MWKATLNIPIILKTAGVDIHKTSGWAEVRDKALRLRSEGGVSLIRLDPDVVASKVKSGDNEYDVEIYRQDPNSRSISMWSCSCPAGQWAFKQKGPRKKLNGRLCAHTLATLFEAHSQEQRKKRDEAQESV